MKKELSEILLITKTILQRFGQSVYDRIPDNFLGEKNTIGTGIKDIERPPTKDLNDEDEARKFWEKTTQQ